MPDRHQYDAFVAELADPYQVMERGEVVARGLQPRMATMRATDQ